MTRIIQTLCILLSTTALFAQDYALTDKVEGTYHMLIEGRNHDGSPASKMLFRYRDDNDGKRIVVKPCEDCAGISFKYESELSEPVKKTVLVTLMGLIMIRYDSNSFVTYLISDVQEYANFYSTDKSKVDKMTKEKALEYAKKIVSTLE